MSQKKIVAHIVQDLKIGGLERVIQSIVTGLSPEKYVIYVLCLTSGGEIANQMVSQGVRVEILHITEYHSISSLLKVVRWLKKTKVDIAHTHGYPAGVLGRVASKIARIGAIYHHVHTPYLGLKYRNRFMEKCLALFTKKVICCSNAVKEFNSKTIGIPPKKLVVVYNAVQEVLKNDRNNFDHQKKRLGISQGVLVIGCVASLVSHKGHHNLLEAMADLDQGFLLLVGDGPLQKDLQRHADKLGLTGRIAFAGSQWDVTPYLQMMDVVVLASPVREGLGNALIEAMALSKPVVATRVGGMPEVVQDGQTGILVAPNDHHELAKAIEELIAQPEVRRRMGNEGRRRYEKMFRPSMIIDQLDRLYSDELVHD